MHVVLLSLFWCDSMTLFYAWLLSFIITDESCPELTWFYDAQESLNDFLFGVINFSLSSICPHSLLTVIHLSLLYFQIPCLSRKPSPSGEHKVCSSTRWALQAKWMRCVSVCCCWSLICLIWEQCAILSAPSRKFWR